MVECPALFLCYSLFNLPENDPHRGWQGTTCSLGGPSCSLSAAVAQRPGAERIRLGAGSRPIAFSSSGVKPKQAIECSWLAHSCW
jgi:hypothetical protein